MVVHWGQRADTLPDATGFAIALDLLTMTVGAVAAFVILEFAGGWLPIPGELRESALAFTIAALLVARGKAILNFLLRAVPTALALAALPWLVDHHGALGAAFAVLAASAMTVVGFVLANRQKVEI